MGKSTTMKHLALSWADGTEEGLRSKFDFVFHISLKRVRGDQPIEHIIISQHSGLEANRVMPWEITSILENNKVLLLMDGYDEYKTGINSDIDRAFTKRNLWNSYIVLTSRETDQIKNLKEYMDAEAEIHGFDRTNVKKYITHSLGCEEKAEALLDQAKRNSLYDNWKDGSLLSIPILLHMICVLFMCKNTLPRTKTGIMQAIVDRCIDRECLRAKGEKAVAATKQVLLDLGKLAWEALNEPGKKLLFDRVSKVGS